MADMSAAAHPGPGHLLGHVLRDGQTFSMAAYRVCILNVYVEVQLLFILCLKPFFLRLVVHLFSHWVLLESLTTDRAPVSVSCTISVTPLTAQ